MRNFVAISLGCAVLGGFSPALAQQISSRQIGPVVGGAALVPTDQRFYQPAGRRPLVEPVVMPRPLSLVEEDAHMLWNLRAALNVAALQCQFSPYLATVRNYNDILKTHSLELEAARLTLVRYFDNGRRGAGQKLFDQYTTKTYNSFATLDGQLSFCSMAGEVGRAALATPVRNLSKLAKARMTTLRASLVGASHQSLVPDLAHARVAPSEELARLCLDRRGRFKKRC